MKKFVANLLGGLMRCYTILADPSQRAINQKIARRFHLWVAEKKFCNPDLSLSDVAEEFGVSEEALAYFFSTVMKERFSSVRKRLRLEEARRIICEHPEYRIIYVASRVGILDKCNFRKQFFQQYGYPPSEWQRRCAEMKAEGKIKR